MYDDELQNINWHFAGQENWEKSKKCNTCKKNPDWYYCGDYLGALDVYTGEHYEDIFEKINDIISELPNTATITLDSEPFLTVASGSTTNITLEDEDGNPVAPIGSDGSVIVLPNAITDLFWELHFNGTDDVIFIHATVGNVGTFTSGSGSDVGTINVSTDGVTYGTVSFPFTPTSGNTYYFKRSTATVNGLFTLIGTY